MDFVQLKKMLAFNGERIRALVEGMPEEQARWRPDAASWSVLEVINHLCDEERSDFRVTWGTRRCRADEIGSATKAEGSETG